MAILFCDNKRKQQSRRGKAFSFRGAVLFCSVLWLFVVGGSFSAEARSLFGGGETHSLKIYFVHTGQREDIVFKKNGRYVRSGLQRLNYMLRDWRRNEATSMAPDLFDLLWQIYQLSGSKDYFHVVSGYRSPQTNAMLRHGVLGNTVAKHSRHMEGKAIDFYLPDVNLAYLRAIALKLQGGGIGYYPNSGSPFVHVDVGSVRHWPRMSRPALAALFPDGKSLHVPSDGRPLAAYAPALAEYRRRSNGAVPVYSPRALFGHMTARQVILAAADGHLPLGRSGRLQGMGNLPQLDAPPLLAPAAPPIYALPLPPQVPIPAERDMPLPFGVESEQAEDEADVKMSPVPIPHFKNNADKEDAAGAALLAYAPQNIGQNIISNAAGRALAAALVPLPQAKPFGSAAFAADAGLDAVITASVAKPIALESKILPLPQAKPQRVAFETSNAVAALIMQSRALPFNGALNTQSKLAPAATANKHKTRRKTAR